MSQVTYSSFAVAVTVIPPALALEVIGPTLWSLGLAAHIHTGIPTRPMLSGAGFGRDADVDGSQPHLLHRDLRDLAGSRPCARVRRRVLRPDHDEHPGLRLAAVVDRAVAWLVPLPDRIARRGRGSDRTDVAVVAVRPVAVGRLARDRTRRWLRDALRRPVPVAGRASAGVLGTVSPVSRRSPDVPGTSTVIRHVAGRRVRLRACRVPAATAWRKTQGDERRQAEAEESGQRRGESGCRAWRLPDVLTRRDAPAAARIGGVL